MGTKKSKFAGINDLVLTALVLLIASMLLVPLPTLLLDTLITLNLTLAILLLLVGLYLPTSLDLLTFPSLLLLTTLFRLSLNVASTRLILSNGDAGQVIQSVGTFLIRGEVVVGLIIFMVITIVNYLVIAKGASRVSEVAARFALDALPGKQLAIDADLRAGLLTPNEARLRRDMLQKESQLYGAMDGSMKFIQGDAIAGFFIIMINVVGGIYLGIQKGLSFGDAVQSYTILTVGDGLVSQIPAIMISVCAGIVVTRVSASSEGSLALDIKEQIFSQPTVLLLTGGLIVAVGFLPGLPSIFFWVVGSFAIIASWVIGGGWSDVRGGDEQKPPLAIPMSSSSTALEEDGSAVLLVDSHWLFPLYKQNSSQFKGWWKQVQADFYKELGLHLPPIVVVPVREFSTGKCRIELDGIGIISRKVPSSSILVEMNPDQASLLGFEVAQDELHPLTTAKICWVDDSATARQMLDQARVRWLEPLEFAALDLAYYYAREPGELFTLADIHSSLKSLEKRYPGFIADTLNQDIVDIPCLARVVGAMAREGISVKDLKVVIELVSTYLSTYRISTPEEFDFAGLFAFVRVQRKRALIGRVLSDRGSVRAVLLSESVQELFEQVPFDGLPDSPLPIQPDNLEVLVNSYESVLNPIRVKGVLPVVLLVSSDLLPRVDVFLRGVKAPERVIAIEELDPLFPLESVGVWNL